MSIISCVLLHVTSLASRHVGDQLGAVGAFSCGIKNFLPTEKPGPCRPAEPSLGHDWRSIKSSRIGRLKRLEQHLFARPFSSNIVADKMGRQRKIIPAVPKSLQRSISNLEWHGFNRYWPPVFMAHPTINRFHIRCAASSSFHSTRVLSSVNVPSTHLVDEK